MVDDLSSFNRTHCGDALPLSGRSVLPVLEEFHSWDCIGFLGIQAKFAGDCAIAQLSPQDHHLGGHSGGRWVNGPTILSMIDASMALAGLAHVAPAKVATVNLSTNFLEAVPDQTFFCAAYAVRMSGRMVHCRAVVFGDKHKTYATATGILAVIQPKSVALA